MEDLELTKEWDKIFPKSYKVNHSKVTFRNRYGITLAADMYTPKNINGKMAAIAISGPFGAVKEQASGLYAQTMAERGFLTIAFDPSYTGESGGTPRYVASPDINTEDFSAAVDFLSVRDDVDPERIGILGVNGAGKSTLVKGIVGDLAPMAGELRRGQGLEIGYFAQHQLDQLRPDESPLEHMRRMAPDVREQDLRDYLGIYRFSGDFASAPVGPMSGGEKARLALALLAWRKPNLLVLDEPTNDLDIVTLNVLEEYLRNFKGCAIVVSHDRYFMDKVVDHLLVFRGNADIKDFPGNYTQYREWKEVQDQLEKETEAARQARMAPTVEKTSRLEKVQKKKLTFKERKEFEALEVEIPLLEAEKAELETAMSSGTLSNDELLAKSERIAKVIEEIDEKTMRWLELSELA